MKIGPKYKICRRLGSGVFDKCQTQKFNLSQSRKSANNKRFAKVSDYGKQLLEKQKVRFSYGITEKQLRRYVANSVHADNSVEAIHASLEMRLDNVVYRAGFAKTRRMARQLVAHGHIDVNGRRLKVPSYAVKEGDVVSVRERSKQKPVFANLEKGGDVPSWMDVDVKKMSITVKKAPVYEPGSVLFDYHAVFEFYSR